jgi:uncharacterized protein (DUF2237 family)
MATQQANIKEIIQQEYVKCCLDPIHFFRKYCYITHPVKGRILFHLYSFQEETLSKFHTNRFSIINKSRQLGISTLVAAYSLWLMLFNKDKTVLCIATKQETAKGMVEKVQFMYNNLPTWMRGNQKPISDNKLSLKLANNSQIIATSAASDAGRSYAVSLLIIDEAAFIEGIDKIYTSIKPTIATGGGIIALSSPNGIGNWFHKMYKEAQINKNDFCPIELKWDLHPDRDKAWEERERNNMSPREFAQEYDCDFLGSGNSVIESDILSFYEQTYIQDPVERRFMGGDYWIWQYPDYSKSYIVCADVARGDGSDYSAFHVIDVEACEQVAEYKSQIGTRDFGHMLVSIATEYNNALLVPENANVGWDVINTIIEKGYQNLHYSPRAYGEMHIDKWMAKMDSEQTVPGFTTSIKTRPLVISKMEAYLRDRAFVFHSQRLLEELRVFIWQGGKAQAQSGYNDDLVMSLGIGLFTRDTGVKFHQQGMDITRRSLDGISRTGGESNNIPMFPINMQNPFQMEDPYGGVEDITWLL